MRDIIPKGDSEGKYTDEFRLGLAKARLDMIKGRTYSHAELKKSLGL